MTVQEFFRAYFSLGSKFQNISVQRNENGRLRYLYSSDMGYVEQYMRPEVRAAIIRGWGIEARSKIIWVTVE